MRTRVMNFASVVALLCALLCIAAALASLPVREVKPGVGGLRVDPALAPRVVCKPNPNESSLRVLAIGAGFASVVAFAVGFNSGRRQRASGPRHQELS